MERLVLRTRRSRGKQLYRGAEHTWGRGCKHQPEEPGTMKKEERDGGDWNRELVVLPRCTLQERKSFCQLWVFNSLPNRFLRTFWWSPCLFMRVLSSGNHAIPGIGNLLADRPSQPSFFISNIGVGFKMMQEREDVS